MLLFCRVDAQAAKAAVDSDNALPGTLNELPARLLLAGSFVAAALLGVPLAARISSTGHYVAMHACCMWRTHAAMPSTL